MAIPSIARNLPMKPVSEAVQLRRLFWTTFAVRLGACLLALLLTKVYQLPIMEDALYYSYRASEAAQCWLTGEQSRWLTESMDRGREAWLMVTMLGVFYCFSGGIEVLPLAIAGYCLLTSLAPILAFRAAREFGA